MTPRERLTATFEGKQPTGRVPHFELVFFLTMEAFGRVDICVLVDIVGGVIDGLVRTFTRLGPFEHKNIPPCGLGR